MIFVGFGFLMTFMRTNGFNSVGFNFMIATLAIQLSILINGFFHNVFSGHWNKISLDIETLIAADFAAGAVLITYGALLGKVSPLQLMIIATCELVFYAVNESIGVIKYEAIDMGGSMFIHTFGAYFGLAVSFMITKFNQIKKLKPLSTATTDLFAMIGTIFLWMYWPSFNGALASGNSQHRVVINTVLSLTGSCLVTFLISKQFRGKLSMVDIQNATLAGGVAVGSSADLVILPYGALIIGVVAGIVSTFGYIYLQPWLEKKIKLHDTCGVNNLHGLPGIIGGISGAISAGTASVAKYGDSIEVIFPARAGERSAGGQAGFQLAALSTTLGIALVGGLLTGAIIRSQLFNKVETYFSDGEFWEMDLEEHERPNMVHRSVMV